MKKKFAILLVLAVMISVSACGTPNDKPITTGSDVISESTEGLQSTYNDTSGLDADVIRPDAPQMSTTIPEETWPDLDGNPYTTHKVFNGKTEVWIDYSEVYETLDLSQYTRRGSFGEDGLMWVEKADYTGKRIGYIDYKGNEVIPLMDTIERACDFHKGYAVIVYEEDSMGNGMRAIIDTKGDVKLKYKNHAISGYYNSSNGNVVLAGVNLNDDLYGQTKNYIFCSNSEKTIEIQGSGLGGGMYYSDGLLRTKTTVWRTNENKPYSSYKHVVTFYDENGEIALVVDCDSSEYFRQLMYVSDFENGQAEVTFVGLDRNWYKVNIDKNGKWVDEPVKISKDVVGNDFFR